MPSYGSTYLDFLRSSESESFRAWGEMMQVGVSVTDGLERALTHRSDMYPAYYIVYLLFHLSFIYLLGVNKESNRKVHYYIDKRESPIFDARQN